MEKIIYIVLAFLLCIEICVAVHYSCKLERSIEFIEHVNSIKTEMDTTKIPARYYHLKDSLTNVLIQYYNDTSK